MDSFEFNNVKAEKEDALWRYNMEKNLRFGLQFIGFLLALFLTSWSLVPDIFEVAGDLRLRFINTLDEPLLVFLVLNIIILVVYVLSSHKQIQKQSDIYDEYVRSCRGIIPTPAVAEKKEIILAENLVAATETKRPSAEETTVDKQIVPVENAGTVAETKRSVSPLQNPPPSTATSLTLTKPNPVITSTDKVKQKEYRRTRSLVTEPGNQRPRREFKRSETTMMGRESLWLQGLSRHGNRWMR
ncbi:CYP722 protein [Hibiscus syriacus]|uniref:CYP722 protein n=1 Tax=Hibiscus syriacus TaxID=106335 RepID=A0A6A3AK14_HIBSY|nr:uncharacterized protein LOC120126458 [Hibiscus syriacus]KAE8704193.1 CYP722 protein [Hibiscus syriacus]